MKESLALAELKGYITAKVDQYTEMANTCVKSISIDRVITDMNNILDLIIDMQGYKEKKRNLIIFGQVLIQNYYLQSEILEN